MVDTKKMHTFVEQLKVLAETNGVEVKTTREGVVLWPAYDPETGNLGEWFTIFVKVAE